MAFNVLNRQIHYWASVAVAVPLLVMIASGLFLQAKKHWSWVQPAEQPGTGTQPVVDMSGKFQARKTAANDE